MIPYTTTTGTRSTIEKLHRLGWRLMLTPDISSLPHGFRYAIDNGAWSAHNKGVDWGDVYRQRFERLVERHGPGSEFIVCPDVVGNAEATFDLAEKWLPRLRGIGRRRLIAVQNGMEPDRVRPFVGWGVGIFVGGDTEWKERTIRHWGRLARTAPGGGCYLHVGRVNTARRVALCRDAGVDSFDGTSAVRFPPTIPMLTREARQQGLFHLQESINGASHNEWIRSCP